MGIEPAIVIFGFIYITIWRLIVLVIGWIAAIITLRSRPRFDDRSGTMTLSGTLSGFKGLISRSYYYISSLDLLRSLILVHLLYLGL